MAKPATLDKTRSYGEVHPADVVYYLQDHKEFDHRGIEILANDEDTAVDEDTAAQNDYETWKAPRLNKEIKARRGKGVQAGTTKVEMIEILRALDAADAAAPATD